MWSKLYELCAVHSCALAQCAEQERQRFMTRTHTHQCITVPSELQCVHTRRIYLSTRRRQRWQPEIRNQDFKNTTISRFPIAARRFSIRAKLSRTKQISQLEILESAAASARSVLSRHAIFRIHESWSLPRATSYICMNSERNKKITNQAESPIKANARTKRRPIAEQDEEEYKNKTKKKYPRYDDRWASAPHAIRAASAASS
ncbi:unnamed protein product [Trichogramma brassicae]|uniref:Uncharacterized protein n=1 Tax=Trichogramma brassicae TaxID=86971 RepID=A0A6H5HYW7_9HYME|nr:unnamed protein product [Trichogramma brassicae]